MKKEDFAAVFAIAVFYGILQLSGITCPIRFLTGISCAGCGMTRAWLAALQLNFRAAFSYHPLFLLAIPMGLLFLFRQKLTAGKKKIAWGFIITAMMICYLTRMADPSDTLVVFAPDQGMIAVWIRLFLKGVLKCFV